MRCGCYLPLLSEHEVRFLCCQAQAMIDLRDCLERFETTAAECYLIAQLATDNAKRELYLRLALRNRDLAAETRKAIREDAWENYGPLGKGSRKSMCSTCSANGRQRD
jgi:hypothetical protein